MKDKNTEAGRAKKVLAISGNLCAGKSSVSLSLAEAMYESDMKVCMVEKDCNYELSSAVFRAGRAVNNRQSKWYQAHCRNPEMYAMIQNVCYQIPFVDYILCPSPFTRELREEIAEDRRNPLLQMMRREVNARGADLVLVFIRVSPDNVRQRFYHRFACDKAAARRTPSALRTLEKDLKKNSWAFEVGADLDVPDVDETIFFDGDHAEQSFELLKERLGIRSGVKLDTDITLRSSYRALDFSDLLETY